MTWCPRQHAVRGSAYVLGLLALTCCDKPSSPPPQAPSAPTVPEETTVPEEATETPSELPQPSLPVPSIEHGSEWTTAVSAWERTSPWWQPDRSRPDKLPPGQMAPFFVANSDAGPKFSTKARLWLWWQTAPEKLRQVSFTPPFPSNIHPQDYVGPDACAECHPEQHEAWSKHPHRFMNSLAADGTVKGDFAGTATIDYLGGRARFYRDGLQYRMALERGTLRRVYHVTQTLGSRFFQYYVGHQIEGPQPTVHPLDRVDHVLPFGFWIEENEWVPVVHLDDERPDGERADPFDGADSDKAFFPYYTCNHCHTTFPLGDMLIRYPNLMGRHTTMRAHWFASDYLGETRPEIVAHKKPEDFTLPEVGELFARVEQMDARRYATSLGITCEACHLGGRQHAEGNLEKPVFFPSSKHLLVQTFGREVASGRSHDNLNWVCARCHAGNRPQYANGTATWNSTEYSDAMLGSCYTELKCVDCHDPHAATGLQWAKSPQDDDATCTRCHKELTTAGALEAHTHHSANGTGSRCMDCHMPRLNEGLQDMVRTHTIFSPTERSMLETGQPNACNMCHTDRTIDWTLKYLMEWYGATYDEGRIATAYPDRSAPVAVGWLKSTESHVRLVAATAMARTEAPWALPFLVSALDDPFLVNRQFAARRLEKRLHIRLADFGYRFYFTPKERRPALEALIRRVGGVSGSE